MTKIIEIEGPALDTLRELLAGHGVYRVRVASTGDGRVSVKVNEGGWSAPMHSGLTAEAADTIGAGVAGALVELRGKLGAAR